LRLFLNKQEGGVDETNRAFLVAQGQEPRLEVFTNYASIGMTQEAVSRAVTWQMLGNYTERLFLNYDRQTRELYLRGQHAALATRQERLLRFARDDGALAGLAQSPAFRKEFAEWLVKLRSDSANLDDGKANH